MEKINQTSGAADTLEPQAGAPDAPAPKAEKSAADSFYCYIGPSITGLIQRGDICRGTRKKALAKWDEAIKKYPLIKTLIVSGDKLPEARLKVKKPGNALYKNCQRILGKA